MKKHGYRTNNPIDHYIRPPAYPFTAQELLGDLRGRLAREEGHPLGFVDLASLIGQPKSTAHFWFSLYHHPHLLAFMSLLERLSRVERQSFIEGNCRTLPLVSDPILTGQTTQLARLLAQQKGLTVITGHSDHARSYVLTGLGHSWIRLHRKRSRPSGIDIHRPRAIVPIETLQYIDERLDGGRIRELALQIWPKILTSKSALLLGNRLWSLVPEIRNDLLRIANQKHVVLAEESTVELEAIGRNLPLPTHIVTLLATTGAEKIKVHCARTGSSQIL
ncbi:MAG TPA: hypothetical protein VEC99_02915 [Clostridia bacterium]|nr:hypothetical protein [Clostridia bacterium]